MKKIVFLFAALLMLSSCAKEYNCVCTGGYSSQASGMHRYLTKKKAEEACDTYSPSGGFECHIE